MNRRLLLGAALVVLLAASAGCTGLFGGGVSDERLDQEADYDWDEVPSWETTNGTDGAPAQPRPVNSSDTTDVYVNVTGESYHAVYHLDNYSEEDFEMWVRGISNEDPLDIWALRFRYPNGTVVNGSELNVYETNYRTHVELPKSANGTTNGTIAFSASAEPKSFYLPNYMEGSYEVVLPKGMRTDFFLFGRISPGASQSPTIEDGRVHIQWDELDSTISVKYYLQRDFYLFIGAVGVLGLATIVGLAYYRYRIQELTSLREDLGTTIDVDDGDDR
ncbi:DUF5803 family protein [Haloarchaeobius sp. DFWS5]|uniref:DUF5803 family protein n=1 Tax=Haloarchaeobius sp. DFWS5 TaxID=3446114 RepID=UPI003EBD326E